ncbi:MAG: cytochrome c biogenesis protein ResB [Candidatus Nanopelagicales bacterium]
MTDPRPAGGSGRVADAELDPIEASLRLTSARPRTAASAGLGPRGWIRWGWRLLTSMRTALVLLFLLALAAIPGSVLPQRATNPAATANWINEHPRSGPLLDRAGFFAVFGSPWFSAIYLLLFLSLIGCVLPRMARHWRALREPVPAPPMRLTVLADTRHVPSDDVGAALELAATELARRRWRVRRDPAGQWVAAEQGRARETGNLLFHLALLGVLSGVAAGSLFGWKGQVIVREGTGFANTLPQYDSFSAGRLVDTANLPPFSFTLRKFTATFQREGSQRGAPQSFAAELQYQPKPATAAAERRVEVNQPLRLDGAKVFLLGHGYAPHLRVTDGAGDVVFDDTVVFLPEDGNFTSRGVLKLPDAAPALFLQAVFLPTAGASSALSIFPAPDNPLLVAAAFTGPEDSQPANVYQLDIADLTELGLARLTMGQGWTLPDGAGQVEFLGFDRWASFSIAHDPGKVWVLLGALAGLAGLCLSLYVRRRRVWIVAQPLAGDGRPGLLLAGIDRSGRDTGGVACVLEWLAGKLPAVGPATSQIGSSHQPIEQSAQPDPAIGATPAAEEETRR